MKMESIIPMQNSLRDLEQLPAMIEFAKKGGIFSKNELTSYVEGTDKKVSPLIKIVRFEDGADYWHDGHHRATAIWIAGRRFLYPEEFVVENWTYREYQEINLSQRWYTPFDPRIEVRINHILPYKAMIDEFINKEPKPTEEEIRLYILDHYEAKAYTEPRSAKSIAEVARRHTPIIVGVE